jgi:uncharacterized membrane protein
MPRPFVPAFRRHSRFYIALASGTVAVLLAGLFHLPAPFLLGGDVLYLVFLTLCLAMVARISTADFAEHAGQSDEGMGVVILIILATMIYFFAAVFDALGKKHGMAWVSLAFAGVGAPLGWLVLHTAMAFHYADLHYYDDPESPNDDEGDLIFPGEREPGAWDFLYFSFVIGMTCQVSDVQVKTSVMRRAVMGHGLVSFFFNTVFIAMAVNAAVAMAS